MTNVRILKRTTHLSRQMHIVRLPDEANWRLYGQRTGIDPDDGSHPVWVQTQTLSPLDAQAFIDAYRAARQSSRVAA